MNGRECSLKSCSKNPRIMQQDFRNHVARFADFGWSFPVLFAILLYQSVYHFIAQFFCFGKVCTGFFVFFNCIWQYPSMRYAAAAFGSKEIAFSNASIASLCCPTRRCTEPFFHPHGYILRSHFYCFINVIDSLLIHLTLYFRLFALQIKKRL